MALHELVVKRSFGRRKKTLPELTVKRLRRRSNKAHNRPSCPYSYWLRLEFGSGIWEELLGVGLDFLEALDDVAGEGFDGVVVGAKILEKAYDVA